MRSDTRGSRKRLKFRSKYGLLVSEGVRWRPVVAAPDHAKLAHGWPTGGWMAKALTDSVVSKLAPRRGQVGWYEMADGGCRGLRLRVSGSGEMVWAVRHMVGGKRERHTIGGYP